MGTKRPTGITVIAIVTLLLAVGYLWTGIGAFWVGEQMSTIGVMGSAAGGILKAIAVVYLLLGGFSIILSIGLLMMQEWARVHAAKFYEVLAIICLIFFIFNFLLLLYALIYFLFYRHLSRTSTKMEFEEYGYEKPNIDYSRKRTSQKTLITSVQKAREEQPKDDPIKVPDNMILCPNCDALNLKGQDFCKRCATELE